MNSLSNIYNRVHRDAARLAPAIIKLRRHLHQYPEIGHQEFKTTDRLRKELGALNLRLFDGGIPTGLWARFDTGKPGPVVAIRTDIDALPITEKTGLPFASKHDGFMHACGHDVHMAILVGTAQLLSKYKDDLIGSVTFICQPAEEIPPGGARPLIDAGVLEKPKVDAIIALHVDPSLPTGAIGVRDGVNFASVFDFDLTIIGKGGHAALPHHAVDAIATAAEVISGLQQLVSRKIDPIEPAVITFGTIHGGDVRNAVAGEVVIEGTARSLDPALSRIIPKLMKKTAGDIARAFGAKAVLTPVANYPALKTDPRVNAVVTEAFRSAWPDGKVLTVPKIMGAEDFACYLEKVPGTMIRLGCGNKKIGADKSWHNPAFMVDEEAIAIGIMTMTAATAALLHTWSGGTR